MLARSPAGTSSRLHHVDLPSPLHPQSTPPAAPVGCRRLRDNFTLHQLFVSPFLSQTKPHHASWPSFHARDTNPHVSLAALDSPRLFPTSQFVRETRASLCLSRPCLPNTLLAMADTPPLRNGQQTGREAEHWLDLTQPLKWTDINRSGAAYPPARDFHGRSDG